MKPFMDADFLLSTPAARTLYHAYAEAMPIIDYHCHVSPKEIFEDRRFANLTEAWLSGDHYKWRLMRSNGVDERFITGDASDREKFQKFAETLPRAIGNPMYHWCHLELKKYFGCEGTLNGDTAQAVWALCEEKFRQPGMGVRGLIEQSNVAFIGTTDDPVDSLEWHEKLAADPGFTAVAAPSFRPDKALNIDKPGWLDYIKALGVCAGTDIGGADALKAALRARMDHFDAHGCRASDHGLDRMVYRPFSQARVESVFQKGLSGEAVTAEEAEGFKTELLLFCARCYHELDWAMQLHFNCLRNPNSALFERLGPDMGFDCIGPNDGSAALRGLLDALYRDGTLPRTVLYSLDPKDNEFLGSLIGSFQGAGLPGRLQHGSAWWFNDNKSGMTAQMTSLANLGILGNFVGMLTDSRSFLSYTRHEYFRRVLCELVGGWMENGEYPADFELAGGLIRDICYHNAARYFKL